MENGGFTTKEVTQSIGLRDRDTETTQSTQDCIEEFEMYLKSVCTIKDQCRSNNNQPNLQPALENSEDAIKDIESQLQSITYNAAPQLLGENHGDPIKDFEVMLQAFLISPSCGTQRNNGAQTNENNPTYNKNYSLNCLNNDISSVAVPEEVENKPTWKRGCDDMYPAEVTDHNYPVLKKAREMDKIIAHTEVKTGIDAGENNKRNEDNSKLVSDYHQSALIDELYTEEVLNCSNVSTKQYIRDAANVDITPTNFMTMEQLTREIEIVVNQTEFESKVTEINNNYTVNVDNKPTNFMTMEQLIRELEIVVNQSEFERQVTETNNNYTVTTTIEQTQNFVTLEQLQFELELAQSLNKPIQSDLDGNERLRDDQKVVHNEFLNGDTVQNEISYNSLIGTNFPHFDIGYPIRFDDRKSTMLLEKLFPEDQLRACEEADERERARRMLLSPNSSYSDDDETDSDDDKILSPKPSTSFLKYNKKEIKENVPPNVQIPIEYARSSKDSEENKASTGSKTIITRLSQENIHNGCKQSKKSFIKCNFSPNLQSSTGNVQRLSQSNNLEMTTKSNKASKTNPPKSRKEQIPKMNKENIPKELNVPTEPTKNVYNNIYFPAKNFLKTSTPKMCTKSNKASKTNPPKCKNNHTPTAKNSETFYTENYESNVKNKAFEKPIEKNNVALPTILLPEASGLSIQNSARSILANVMSPKDLSNDIIPIKNSLKSNDSKPCSKSNEASPSNSPKCKNDLALTAKNQIVAPQLQIPMHPVKSNISNNTFEKQIENTGSSIRNGTHNILTNVILPKNVSNNNFPIENLSKLTTQKTHSNSNKSSQTNPPKCKKDHTQAAKNENVASNLQNLTQNVKNFKDGVDFHMGNKECIKNAIVEKRIENDNVPLQNLQPKAPELPVQKKVQVKKFVRRNVKGDAKIKIDVTIYPLLIDLSNFISEKLQVIKQFQIRTVNKMVYGKEGKDATENLLEHINSSQEEYEELLESQQLLSQQSVSFTPEFVDFTAVKLSTDESKNQNDPKLKQRLSTALDDIFKDVSLINQEGAQDLNVPKEINARIVLQKIALVFCDVLNDINAGVFPEFRVWNQDNWDNVMFFNNRLIPKSAKDSKYSFVKYSQARSRNKFALIVQLLAKIIDLIVANMTCTKRELYYQLKKFAKSQRQVDNAITVITSLIGTPSWEFGVYATTKGLVYGNLSLYFTNGEIISCLMAGGLAIPFNVRNIIKIETNASFIVIVEKDSVFQKLLAEDLPNKLAYPFILVTGKGFADITTRLFVRKIWQSAAIPVFILVDCDPFGIEIMLTYRFGSLGQAHLSDHLALPQLRWLGLHPSDLVSMGVETLPMTYRDREKLSQLLTRPFINAVPRIREELEALENSGVKAEIEGVMKSMNFLCNFYLPIKLCDKDYI